MRGGRRSGQEDRRAGYYCIRWMVRRGRRIGQKHWILRYQMNDERRQEEWREALDTTVSDGW
jgi:hypothetical protein